MKIQVESDVTLDVTDIAGAGRVVVLLHAWGLNSRMWNAQIVALAANGNRVVAIDRRAHGRSDCPSHGYDLPTLAGDVATVLEQLNVEDVVLVGHSMGGLEAVTVAAGPARDRLGALVLSAPTTPCLQARPDNPNGVPPELFDANRTAMSGDFAAWVTANTDGYWGTGVERVVDTIWTQQTLHSMPLHVLLATNSTITAADVRGDLGRITMPTLVIHGDADLSVPLGLTGEPTAAALTNGRLVIVEGAGHGLYSSHASRYTTELLAFIEQR